MTLINAVCSKNISKTCKKIHQITKKSYRRNINKNGEYICKDCTMVPVYKSIGIIKSGVNKYNRNDDFFSEPNLLNCYWAGFIAADGCVWSNTKAVAIKIHQKDRIILERFKQNIEYEGRILDDYKTNSSRIIVYSEQFKNDLYKNFNICSKKSLTLIPPNIHDEELIKAFIIGYIDGDGSIFFSKNNHLKISAVGTREMLDWIRGWFIKWSWSTNSKYVYGKSGEEKNTFQLSISGKRAKQIFKILKQVSVDKLERKWEKEID